MDAREFSSEGVNVFGVFRYVVEQITPKQSYYSVYSSRYHLQTFFRSVLQRLQSSERVMLAFFWF